MRPVDLIFPKEYEMIKQGLCPICKEEVGELRNEISRKEFKISRMCQKCQDLVLGVD